MRARTCPLCSHQFKRGKRNNLGRTCCPNNDCGVELYYTEDDDGNKITILYTEYAQKRDTAKCMLSLLTARLGFGPDHEFDYTLYAKEYSLAYEIIDRSEKYLSQFRSGPKIDHLRFSIEVVEYALQKMPYATSLAFIVKPLPGFAQDLYRAKKQAWERSQALKASSSAYVDVGKLEERIDGMEVRRTSWNKQRATEASMD